MNKLIFTSLMVFVVFTFSSCTKEQELDEETTLLLEKENKLEMLDKIFYLSFEDADKASEELNSFVQEKLITKDKNYLTDNDVLERKKMTSLMIAVNQNFNIVSKKSFSSNSLFAVYESKVLNEIFNKGQYSGIPPQLKETELGKRFLERINKINSLYQNVIQKIVSRAQNDKNIIGKRWTANIDIPESVKFNWKYFLKIKDNLVYDFILEDDNTINAKDFFLTPVPKGDTYMYAGNFKDLEIAKTSYYIYDNKLFMIFPIKNNYDPVTRKGSIQQNWFYEFDYEIKNNNLIIRNPKILGYKQVSVYSVTPKDEIYNLPSKIFPNEMKEITLSKK